MLTQKGVHGIKWKRVGTLHTSDAAMRQVHWAVGRAVATAAFEQMVPADSTPHKSQHHAAVAYTSAIPQTYPDAGIYSALLTALVAGSGLGANRSKPSAAMRAKRCSSLLHTHQALFQ